MDLRPYSPTEAQCRELQQLIGYQPYIFSDGREAGIADIWMNKSEIKTIVRTEDNAKEWERFHEANQRMRTMYDDWINEICSRIGSMTNKSVVDTASNNGFFLYRFLEKGAASALGYDINPKFTRLIELLNEVTGLEASFINRGYDQMTHEIPDCEPADIVISSAIMCHISDPVYYLNFLGSITKTCLFLFSTVDNDSRLRITYNEPGKFYKLPFPICFDNMTTISWPLLRYGLMELGFRDIIEIPHKKEWLPYSWYKQFKAVICMK